MRGLRLYWLARVALSSGERALTLECLKEATAAIPGFWSAVALRSLVTCLPGVELSRQALRAFDVGARAYKRLLQVS
jgi:hypothetical protein